MYQVPCTASDFSKLCVVLCFKSMPACVCVCVRECGCFCLFCLSIVLIKKIKQNLRSDKGDLHFMVLTMAPVTMASSHLFSESNTQRASKMQLHKNKNITL